MYGIGGIPGIPMGGCPGYDILNKFYSETKTSKLSLLNDHSRKLQLDLKSKQKVNKNSKN